MKIKINSFCSISRNPDWHDFLERVAPEILKELMVFIRANKSCRTAKTKMIEIYKKLYSMGLGGQFEDFVKRRFPYIVEGDDPKPKAARKAYVPTEKRIVPPQRLNKHGVFKSYNPRILTFPHKLVLTNDNSEDLLAETKRFMRDKISTDYLILENVAYIEYLLPKYKDIANQIPPDGWEIENFRRKNR